MTSDPDFEKQLFALYGEPAAEWSEDGVANRVLRQIDRENRLRRRALGAAAAVGVSLSMVLLAAFAGPLVASAAQLAGAPAPALWVVLFVAVASLGWVTARLTAEA